MSTNDDFRREMEEISRTLSDLQDEKDAIKRTIDGLRNDLIETLSKYNKDAFNGSYFTVTYKMRSTGERMKRGGKDRLREILTQEQWDEIYNEPTEKPVLVVKKAK